MKRLKDVKTPLANFMGSGILGLGPKLGPILWQFPPNFQFDPKTLEAFFKLLPRDTEAAASLARRHDERVTGRASMKIDANRPIRHAMEIRHPSFATLTFIELLRAHDVALVCADTVEWPRLMDITSNFVYCRLHGSEVLYVSGYDERSLDESALPVAAWARGREPEDANKVVTQPGPRLPARDVFVYFDNDAKVRAPFDAKRLIEQVDKLLGG